MYRFVLLAFILCHIPTTSAFAADPSPLAVIATQVNPTVVIPVAQPEPKEIMVATPAAPPEWAQKLIVTAEGLPVVGPFVSKALLYLGILSAILTTLCAAFLSILNILLGAFNATGLMYAAALVAKFRDGKFMYYLQFFSLFNAKKPKQESTL